MRAYSRKEKQRANQSQLNDLTSKKPEKVLAKLWVRRSYLMLTLRFLKIDVTVFGNHKLNGTSSRLKTEMLANFFWNCDLSFNC